MATEPAEARSTRNVPDKKAPPIIEKSDVEARQAFRDKPVLYVLLASLALLIVAFIIIGTTLWVP